MLDNIRYWRPDTCGCALHHLFDRKLPELERVMIPVSWEEATAIHLNRVKSNLDALLREVPEARMADADNPYEALGHAKHYIEGVCSGLEKKALFALSNMQLNVYPKLRGRAMMLRAMMDTNAEPIPPSECCERHAEMFELKPHFLTWSYPEKRDVQGRVTFKAETRTARFYSDVARLEGRLHRQVTHESQQRQYGNKDWQNALAT